MEKRVKIIGSLKWLCFPLGYIMYYFTSDSFGYVVSSGLGIVATMIFWFLMRNEQTRIIGQTIAREIKNAISETSNIESFIEIKRIKNGIIARVYLINAKERSELIHRAISRKIENCTFKKYLWIMQLTDMPGKGALKQTQKLLNDQLLDELMKRRKGDKN